MADDDTLLFEWRIVFDPKEDGGWVYDPQEKRKSKIRGFKSSLTTEFAAMSEADRMKLNIK